MIPPQLMEDKMSKSFVSLEMPEQEWDVEPDATTGIKKKNYPTFYLDSKQMKLPDSLIGKMFQAEVMLKIKSKNVKEGSEKKEGDKEYRYQIEVQGMRMDGSTEKKQGNVQTVIEDQLENEMKNKED